MSRLPVEQLFAAFDGAVPGASALLLRNGEPVLTLAFGLADLESQMPATPTTNYRLASVSKQFTAMATLQLVSDGKLRLEDSLARFFADSPAYWRHITIQQLLTHTSGLPDYEDLIPPDATTQVHDEDVLELVRTQSSGYFAPQTAYRYSNTAYCLLALIIAQVAGQRFPSFLQERIFAPLGMHATVAHQEGISVVPQRAYGHSLRDGVWQRTDQSVTSATLGDGGIYSSVVDLARWDTALAEGTLLPQHLMQALFTPHVAIPNGESYGFGWYLRGQHLAYHTGDTIGFRTAIVRLLDLRATAVVLVNRSDANPLELAEALLLS